MNSALVIPKAPLNVTLQKHFVKERPERAPFSIFSLIDSTRVCARQTDYSQAVDDGASFPALPLPLVHLSEQVEESLLGIGNVTIRRPAQELELTHHQLALLELEMQHEKERKQSEYMLNFVTALHMKLLRVCLASHFFFFFFKSLWQHQPV